MSALRLPIVTKCVRSCLVHACPRHNQGEDVAKSTRSDHHVAASGRCDMRCSRVGVLTSLPVKLAPIPEICFPWPVLGPEDIKPAQAKGRSADGQKRPNSIKAHHAVNRWKIRKRHTLRSSHPNHELFVSLLSKMAAIWTRRFRPKGSALVVLVWA
jgi:hypothetical protein